MRNMLTVFWKPIGIMLLVLMFTAPASAVNCDNLQLSGMTDAQIVQLKQQCIDIQKKAADAASTIPTVSTQDLSQYAELGQKYGIALSEVAKSVGTTVNELAQTPVGIFMLIMVGWKVMGHDLLGIIGGFLWFIVMIPLWLHFFNRLVLKDRKIDEECDPTTGKVKSRTIYPIKYQDGPGPMAGFLAVALILICICGFVMVF